MYKEQISQVAHWIHLKKIDIAAGAALSLAAASCGGGSKASDQSSRSIGLDIAPVSSPEAQVRSSQSAYLSPTPEIKPTEVVAQTPEQSIMQFSKRVLKPEFVPTQIDNLQMKPDSAKGSVNYITTLANVLHPVYTQSADGVYWGQNIAAVESGQRDGSFAAVMAVFEKYFVMSDASRDLKNWTEVDKNLIPSTYEIVLENPDGSFDTRSAIFDVANSRITAAACHTAKANPRFSTHSCFSPQS